MTAETKPHKCEQKMPGAGVLHAVGIAQHFLAKLFPGLHFVLVVASQEPAKCGCPQALVTSSIENRSELSGCLSYCAAKFHDGKVEDIFPAEGQTGRAN